jgi:hypothetical protein
MKRIIIYTESRKLVVALEAIRVTVFPAKTVNSVQYSCIAVVPADRIRVAEVMAEAISTVHNIPITWGR